MGDRADLERMHCPRCKTMVGFPTGLTEPGKSAIAAEARADTIAAIRRWCENHGLDLHEAKGLGFHITRKPGVCNRCSHPISGPETVCSNCKSVNFDW